MAGSILITELQYSGQQRLRDDARKTIRENIQRKAIQKVIKEELILIEQYKSVAVLVAKTETRMLAEGYSRDEINEGIMDMLKGMGGGYMSYLKQYFVEMLLSKLGMDPKKGIIAYAIKNVLEEMEWTNITQYFGKGGCKPLTDLLLRGVIEGVAEIGMDKLSETLFGGPMDGFLSGTGREMLGEMVKNMTEGLRKPIEDYICGMDMSKLTGGLGGMFGGGAAAGGKEGGAAEDAPATELKDLSDLTGRGRK
tara:strand:+ start:286 stop:1041 length:756 start_codon:yes stop_codon:yes gene_type:complete